MNVTHLPRELPDRHLAEGTPGPERARQPILGVLAVALLVSLLGACSGVDGADDNGRVGRDRDDTTTTSTTTDPAPAPRPEELEATNQSFYTPPEPLPAGEHGDLVRFQLTGDQPDNLTRYRVMYRSETVAGEPTVVTGLVMVPGGAVPEGGWPVLTYARGSSGIADDCAISMAIDGTRNADSMLAAEAWLVEDAVVQHRLIGVVTDYEGIGGPGIHPFLNGVSEARATLDIARAASQIPGLDVGRELGIMGYSQGGHAALWANQISSTWTPEMVVHGTVAGAPASEILDLMAPGALWDQSSMALLTAGMARDDADLDQMDLLTPAGSKFVEVMARTCRPDPTDVEPFAGVDLLRARPDETEPWRSRLKSNVPGQADGASPVLIFHGDADRNVPVAHSETLRRRLCASGVPTERRVLPGADHISGAVPTIADGTTWLAARMYGSMADPVCAA